MITQEFKNEHFNLPHNLTSAQKLIIQILKDNKYSLSETRYLFGSIIETVERTAIIDEFK